MNLRIIHAGERGEYKNLQFHLYDIYQKAMLQGRRSGQQCPRAVGEDGASLAMDTKETIGMMETFCILTMVMIHSYIHLSKLR